jgi:hypothetical protein
MKCPVDDTLLEMSEREGVEVDYCRSAAACGSIAASWTGSLSEPRHVIHRACPGDANMTPGLLSAPARGRRAGCRSSAIFSAATDTNGTRAAPVGVGALAARQGAARATING